MGKTFLRSEQWMRGFWIRGKMGIRLSRHVMNHMKLYGIDSCEIKEAIDAPDTEDRDGNKLTAIKKFTDRFSGYPLKVVYEKTGDDIFIITAYPLKKKVWR
ncbi:MAG: DUF4258 domain-containing protein [Nitrospirae bacterium]|nr:DUF4258 domain-containing protein [Nitrospirota bacterium]MBF0618441.1 DUF4258 domain-containing protein [Nitrospirota bacterium]